MTQPEPCGHYRWQMCALLFFATTINYVDRQILSLLKPIFDVELGWSNAQFGVVNSAFQAAYGVGLLGFGRFIDRFGTKVGYGLSITFWSLAALGHTLVGSVAGFRWARIALGLGEAGNWPAAVKAVAEWFPQRERASATGLFNSGTMVGAVVAPAIIPSLAAQFGWRAAFIGAGGLGFIWLIFWIILYETPEKHPGVTRRELALIWSDVGDTTSGAGLRLSWWQLLRYRQTWSFAVGKFLTDPVYWFYLIWLPDFFNKTQGLSLTKLGPPIVVIYALATVLSISGARLSDHLIQRGWGVSQSRKLCMLVFVLCEIPILLHVKHCGLLCAVVSIGVACGIHQALAANLFTTVSDMFPKQTVASVIGLGGMAGCVGGFLFPIITGRLLDRFTQAGNVNAGYAVLFAICASAYVLAFALNHLCAPRFEPVSSLPAPPPNLGSDLARLS
jgi:ACS family hexuronate transporter-like MFS transporter